MDFPDQVLNRVLVSSELAFHAFTKVFLVLIAVTFTIYIIMVSLNNVMQNARDSSVKKNSRRCSFQVELQTFFCSLL